MRIVNADVLIDCLNDYKEASKGKYTGLKEPAFIDNVIELIEMHSRRLTKDDINQSIKERIERANEEARKKERTLNE